MKLVLAGATGGTGREIVRQGLAAGHRITALVRDPARLRVDLSAEQRERLEVITADVFDAADLVPHVKGADAVISALGHTGTKGPQTVQTDGARALIQAMNQTGVRRLVVISAAGFHTEGDGWFVRGVVKPILGRFLRHPFADMARMERLVREADVDETVVTPPQLTDKPASGSYRTAIDRNPRGMPRASRADVADAVLATLSDDGTIHHWVSVVS